MYRYEKLLKDARVKMDTTDIVSNIYTIFLFALFFVIFVAAVVIPVIKQALAK